MIIHNLVLRDYDKFIVKVNNEIVDCDYKQITKENVELILEGKILTGNVVKLILVNEIYESKLHIKNLYIFGSSSVSVGIIQNISFKSPLS